MRIEVIVLQFYQDGHINGNQLLRKKGNCVGRNRTRGNNVNPGNGKNGERDLFET